jgi:hypothetical protein
MHRSHSQLTTSNRLGLASKAGGTLPFWKRPVSSPQEKPYGLGGTVGWVCPLNYEIAMGRGLKGSAESSLHCDGDGG